MSTLIQCRFLVFGPKHRQLTLSLMLHYDSTEERGCCAACVPRKCALPLNTHVAKYGPCPRLLGMCCRSQLLCPATSKDRVRLQALGSQCHPCSLHLATDLSSTSMPSVRLSMSAACS